MSSFSMPKPGSTPQWTGKDDDDEGDDSEEQQERLPDDATVDVEAERKETNTDEILARLDRELVGLAPVKTRIK
jgi:hypothetical protein